MENRSENNELKLGDLPQRLCGEIQLFDLCDLASCRFKEGRFCGNPELLARFEKIADREPRAPEMYIDQELEDDPDSDDNYDYDEEDDGDDYQDNDRDEE